MPFFKAGRERKLVLDFGRGTFKAAYLEASGETVRFLAFGAKVIDSDDEKNREAIVDFIKRFLKESNIPAKEAHLVISHSDAAVLRHVVLPSLPRQEFAEALRWQLADEAPFDVERATVDWHSMRDHVDEEGVRKTEALAALVRTETIERYLDIIVPCGLSAASVGLGVFHYAALVSKGGRGKTPCALLDIGCGEASLGIYKDGKLLFVRRLAFSSLKLTQALVGSFISDGTKVDLSHEDAERIKCSYGIPQETQGLLEDHLEASEIFSLLRPHLEELLRELKLSFDYFAANIDDTPLFALYLTGGGANLKNLKEFLKGALSFPVLDLLLAPSADSRAKDEAKLGGWRHQVTALAGVVLGSCPINLLPQRVRAQKIVFIEEVSLKVLGFVTGCVFVVSFAMSRFQILDDERRLKDMQTYLSASEEISVLKKKIVPRQEFIDNIQKKRVPADGLLKLLSHLIPPSVTLEELTLEQNERRLWLRGIVKGEDALAETVLTELMERFEASSFFAEAALVSSEKAPEGAIFEIHCDIADS